MDPTYFIAGVTVTRNPGKDPAQDFYDTHSADPTRWARTLIGQATDRIKQLRTRPKRRRSFAVSHPAE